MNCPVDERDVYKAGNKVNDAEERLLGSSVDIDFRASVKLKQRGQQEAAQGQQEAAQGASRRLLLDQFSTPGGSS